MSSNASRTQTMLHLCHRWRMHTSPAENYETHKLELPRAIYKNIMGPWICMGDFNEILWGREKRGGKLKSVRSMEFFRDTLTRCDLSDLGFTGQPYTWSNCRRGPENIVERLDRVLANFEWRQIYPMAHVYHLPRYKSDHNPIVLKCEGGQEHDNDLARPRHF